MDKEQFNSLKLRFDTATDALIDAEKKARETSSEFIKALVKEISPEDSRVDFDDYTDDIDSLYLTIAYDGGNHVEYASNMCSTVNAVYLQTNSKGEEEILLDIEDDSEYELERVLTIDALAVAEALTQIYEYLNKE